MQQKIQLFITLLITAAIFVGCQEKTIRIAHFNIKELSAEKIKDIDDQGIGQNAQLRAAAEIIQQIHPDILLIQEIDHDYSRMIGSRLKNRIISFLTHSTSKICSTSSVCITTNILLMWMRNSVVYTTTWK